MNVCLRRNNSLCRSCIDLHSVYQDRLKDLRLKGVAEVEPMMRLKLLSQRDISSDVLSRIHRGRLNQPSMNQILGIFEASEDGVVVNPLDYGVYIYAKASRRSIRLPSFSVSVTPLLHPLLFSYGQAFYERGYAQAMLKHRCGEIEMKITIFL